jgi:predicted RND superfamily exporter protein
MGWIGDKFTVATSTLPVILFASGSSYAVHVLGRYYLLQKEKSAREAISEALVIVGPPLAIAAGTTSVGFFSFIVTDVTPMRNFGIACGAGVVLCWITSLTLVPAVVALWPRNAAPAAKLARIGDWLVDLWHWSRRYRAGVIGACILAAAICAGPMTRVEVRMEPRAFFRPGSEPWKADRFLNEHFGGNTFILISAHGDLDDPWTMREIERMSDYARSLPGVSQVLSVMDYLKLANWGMGSGRRLPTSQVQAGNLYVFLQNETAIKALLSQDRRNALIEVRVRGDGAEVVRALEEFAKKDLRARPKMPTRDDAADRVAWLSTGFGHKPDVLRLRNAMKLVAEPGNLDTEWRRRRGEVLLEFAKSDDALVLSDAGRASIGALAAESLRGEIDLDGAIKSLAADSPIAADNLRDRLDEERRQMGIARALPLALETAGFDKPTAEETRAVSQALDVLFPRAAGVEPAKVELGAQIAGEPVLNRGFSRSVGRNLDHSLLVSIVAVLLLMFLLFRSPKLAVISMIPSGLTMAVIFGTMGAWGVHIDLGTSLVAGIATGAGSDFAMHYLWYLRRQSADEVSRSVGPVMVVSIVLVALGFVVLALGKSPVMHLFGTLAGLSMALSAFLTCLLVPALLNKFGAPPRSP